jgi:septum site-determining protein MinC
MTAVRQTADRHGRAQSIQFRGGLYTLMRLRVHDPRGQGFFTALMEKIAQAPDFYRYAPVVLDLQDLADAAPFNMAELVRRLRQHQLAPVAVTNATEEQMKAAVNAGLGLMPTGHEAPAPAPQAAPEPRLAAAATMGRAGLAEAADPADGGAVGKASAAGAAADGGGATVTVSQAVRTGQQVVAGAGDLIVLGAVSPGAELRALGNIHVYGTMRGRIFAGAGGDRSARIFCQNLEAELVSIAGVWRVLEDLPEGLEDRPVQIRLNGDSLSIELLS